MAHNGPEIKNPGLSPRQQSALPILAAAPSVAQAARLSGVGRRTLNRWLQDPEFRAQLAQLQRQFAELAKAASKASPFKPSSTSATSSRTRTRKSASAPSAPPSITPPNLTKYKNSTPRSKPWRTPSPFGPTRRNPDEPQLFAGPRPLPSTQNGPALRPAHGPTHGRRPLHPMGLCPSRKTAHPFPPSLHPPCRQSGFPPPNLHRRRPLPGTLCLPPPRTETATPLSHPPSLGLLAFGRHLKISIQRRLPRPPRLRLE